MKISTLIIIICLLLSGILKAQVKGKDRGNINFHFGTVVVYNTYSIGFESCDLIKNKERHQIRPLVRFGGWNSSFASKNIGTQSSIGLSYLFGNGNHFFEQSSEIVSHFDRGLKGQTIVFVGTQYRLYLGYRYQPLDKRIIVKIGFGWKELIQFGFGYRL